MSRNKYHVDWSVSSFASDAAVLDHCSVVITRRKACAGLPKTPTIPSSGRGRAAARPSVKIACGHITSTSDAQQLINDVDLFLHRVLENMVDVKDQGVFRDEPLISYEREDGKISFLGPKRHFDEFRDDDA